MAAALTHLSTPRHRWARGAGSTLLDISAWIHTWTPAVLGRWIWRHRRLTMPAIAQAVLSLLMIAVASADPGTGASAGSEGSALSAWTGIKDSEGVPVAKYTLSLNEGGWSSPGIAVIAWLDSAIYEVYVFLISLSLWIIKFAIEFGWMDIFVEPFRVIAAGISNAMKSYGLAAMALAALAIVVVFTFLAQKTAKAYSQVAMGLLMVAVAATIFANPLADLVGSDGLLAQGRDTGLQVAATVSGGSLSTAGDGANIEPVIATLADRFLRAPTQLMNYGTVTDSISRKCKEAFSKGVENGRGDKLKDDMKGCDDVKGDELHKKAMGNPGSILAALPVFYFLGLFLIAFAFYFTWHLVRAAVQAMFFAILAPPAFAVGVIPGGPQTFAWKTVLDCAMAYLAMILFTAAFGGYNAILDTVFARSGGNPIKAMVLVAIVLAFGFAFFSPLRRMFDRSRDSIAAKIGGAPANAGRFGSRAKGMVRAAALAGAVRGSGRVDTNPPPPSGSPAPAPGAGQTSSQGPADPAASTADAGDAGGADGGGSGGVAADTQGDQGAPASAPAPAPAEAATDAQRSARNSAQMRDVLATAIKLSQSSRATAGSGGTNSVQRHSMSESAA